MKVNISVLEILHTSCYIWISKTSNKMELQTNMIQNEYDKY